MKRRFVFILLLVGLGSLSYATEVSFRFNLRQLTWGGWILDQLVVSATFDSGETLYEFRDDGTGVATYIDEENNESTGTFLWEVIRPESNVCDWGPFMIIDTDFLLLTFGADSQAYISIASDFKSANKYSVLLIDGVPNYTFAVCELSF